MAKRIVRRVVRKAVTDPNTLQKVAATEAACREIINAASEEEASDSIRVEVAPYNHQFTAMTSESWRKVSLNLGHNMVWEGKVRASAKGEMLFHFIPEMNDHLKARGVSYIEVPHTALVECFGPSFITDFTEMMGASPEDLITQALHSIDGTDEKAAELIKEEPEVPMDATSMPGWGAWA